MNLKLLICFVHKKKLLDKILAELIRQGAGGATVLNSTGVGRSKIEDVVLYEGFKDVLRSADKHHFTILCVVKSSKIKKINPALTSLYNDFSEKGVGFFLTVSVDKAWGINFPK
jgi:nitrogen regulatory protein PII